MNAFKPNVVALVLTYNDIENTSKCVQSVCNSDYKNLDVYLIDNNSDFECILPIVEEYPEVTGIQLDENSGYAGGFNQGIKYLFDNGVEFDYIWVVTNDLEVEPDTLSKQVEMMERETDIGFMGPETLQRGGGGGHDQWITGLLDINNPAGILLDNERNTEEIDLIDVEFVIGHCLLVRKETVLDIGLIRDFFIYWEEREWQWRGKNSGWRRCVVPGSLCYHDRDSYGSPVNTYYRIRNFIYFNRIVLFETSGYYKFFFRNVVEELKSCVVMVLRKDWDWKHLLSFVKGLLIGLFGTVPTFKRVE